MVRLKRQRKERPDGFVLYSQSMKVLQLLSDEAAGRVIKCAIEYFLTLHEMTEDQSAEYLAFSILKVDVDTALSRFRELCQRNAENRGKDGQAELPATSGDHSSPVVASGRQNINEIIDIKLSDMNLSDMNLDKDAATGKPAPALKSKKFIPPTVEQVDEYIRGRNSQVDAQRFVDFYTAKNWMVGRNRMADWKAAVRTWEKRDTEKKTTATPDYSAPDGFDFV